MTHMLDTCARITSREDALWELYHHNAKTGRHDLFTPPEVMALTMRQMPLTFAALSRPPIDLPPPRLELRNGLDLHGLMAGRTTPQNFRPDPVPLEDLATLLFVAAGENRTAAEAGTERPFRVVPSGGALYPLELYVHAACVDGLEPGVYHYDPTRHALRLHLEGDHTEALAGICVQPALPRDTAVQMILSAIPGRSTLKYGERGYRFTLLEAGHAAQNLLLAARALGLAGIPVGGYRDEALEELLGFDGVNHVALYLCFVGHDDDA